MTAHLLLVTIGPVQDFIAQARRTRDLWFGSHLLSEISRTAAKTVVECRGRLIFPALDRDVPEELAELSVCLKPLRDNGKPSLNIANKILAEVPVGANPETVAIEVRRCVVKFWMDTAARIREDCEGLLAERIGDIWNEQIKSLIEFSATWAPIDPSDGGYKSARERVEKAIAARKNLRDFERWEKQRGGVPKSSLDGARETVLHEPDKRAKGPAQKYRIAKAEQLDAVGLVKRTGGKPDQFVPLNNVALASWIALAVQHFPDEFKALRDKCDHLKLARVVRPDLPCAKAFEFDASILLPSRWRPTFEEQELGTPAEADSWGQKHIRPLLGRMSEPCPYVASLVADGDHMGGAIDKMEDADAHRTFSRNLAKFATEARTIVELQYRGSLVYSGGDDVLAFLPLPEVLGCAEALRQKFNAIMEVACASIKDDKDFRLPTLSVGIGIGHVMEGMGDLLALGRKAEKLAKGGDLPKGQDRNALEVILDKRSGGMRQWRAQWSEWGGNPAKRLADDANAFDGDLSSRKVYEIARLLRRLPDARKVREEQWPDWALVLRLEVARSLARMDAGGETAGAPKGANVAQRLGLMLDQDIDYKHLREVVAAWIDRVLIAAVLSDARPSLRNEATGAAA